MRSYRCARQPRLWCPRARVSVQRGEIVCRAPSGTACLAGLRVFGCWSNCQIAELVPAVIAEPFLFLMTSTHSSLFIPPLPGRQLRVPCATEIQLEAGCLRDMAEGHSRQWRGWVRKQPNQNCQLMPLKTLNSSMKGFIGPQGFRCAIQVLEGACVSSSQWVDLPCAAFKTYIMQAFRNSNEIL